MAIDIKKSLKKFHPHLLKAKEENLNEADTVHRLIKLFEEVLGWDSLTEITRETQIKDKYVDFSIRYEGKTVLLIEAKRADVVLHNRHIEQAEQYAAHGNHPWVLLTNGLEWILFHLTFEEGIESVRAFAVNLETGDFDAACQCLSLLHKQSIKNDALEEFWNERVALSAESIAKAIFNEDTLRTIRREIRKNEDILIDTEDLALAIHEMLSIEARERIGPMKIKKKRKPRIEKTATVETCENPSEQEPKL